MITRADGSLLAPLGPGLRAIRAGRILTGLLYLVLVPLAALTEEPEQKRLHSDLYIMF